MGNLLTSLLNSTGALSTYNRVFDVIQNNITNANTPGYVKQTQDIIALPFQPNGGPAGGVFAGPLLSSRNTFLERAVRDAQQQLGTAQEKASDLNQVQSLFGLNGNFPIPDSFDKLFSAFSQLSVNPSDAVLRQEVINQAGNVSQQFNQVSKGINSTVFNVDQATRDTVSKINAIADRVAEINKHNQGNAAQGTDAGLDAQLYSNLEELSTSVNINVIPAGDGTFNLYLGSQTPLVVGAQTNHISADFSSSSTAIRDADGNDITGQIKGGALAGQLQVKNSILPGYLTDLNTLAQTFADSVNTALGQGLDKNGNAPTTNLFSYNLATDAAATIKVTNITPDQIAAASATAPGGGGNAIAISQLASAQLVGGASFSQAYGNLAARVGRNITDAQTDQAQYQDIVSQARSQRSAATGVSYDEEAAKLLQFQQAYQAVGKLVSVLDTLAQTVINLIQ